MHSDSICSTTLGSSSPFCWPPAGASVPFSWLAFWPMDSKNSVELIVLVAWSSAPVADMVNSGTVREGGGWIAQSGWAGCVCDSFLEGFASPVQKFLEGYCALAGTGLAMT